MTPKNTLPDDPRPTAPTWYLEIGGRAKLCADLTRVGRRRGIVRADCLAKDSASGASITNLVPSIAGDGRNSVDIPVRMAVAEKGERGREAKRRGNINREC